MTHYLHKIFKSKKTKISFALICVLLICGNLFAQEKSFIEQRPIFSSKLDGVNVFRIPSLITLPSSTILALCEARDGGDKTPTDLVLRRSEDNGISWGKIETVLIGQGGAIMNPTPVYDLKKETLWLFVNYVRKSAGFDRIWALKSKDEGKTWSTPIDLTSKLGPVHIGPAAGVQLRNGRLIIPGRAIDENTQAMVVYSDDYGDTWSSGDLARSDTNESQAVELANGNLMLNMRNTNGSFLRAVSLSKDGGETWFSTYEDATLIEPICQGTICRLTLKENGFEKNRILFANPSQQKRGNRTNMTVKMSYDEGKTWPVSKVVNLGKSAYSCLTVMNNGTIGLLYEGGNKSTYETIIFARFNLEWLSDGKDFLIDN